MSGKCQAQINQGPRKGQLCNRPTDSAKYCPKHARQQIVDSAIEQNVRYCDIARGCFTPLEDHQHKCTHCLHKARIRDRKREDKKRQDETLCLDCGNTLTDDTRAKGKHDKPLRRCVPCYEKLLKCESKRQERERNYKAEAFTNKHVIWNHYVKGACTRKIDFTLSKTFFNSLIVQPCFYCSYSVPNEVNGIDRIDNNKGYIESNCIPCCQFCNSAKGMQHPQEFIDKLLAIHIFKIKTIPINPCLIEKWAATYLSRTQKNFKSYQKSANKRNVEFKLSEDEFHTLVSQPCYLCGVPVDENNKNGIDRFNNNFGYFTENCRPCCGHCNLLKKELLYEKVIKIAEKVAQAEKYESLTAYFSRFVIEPRISKIEARIKQEEPASFPNIPREYKPLNEIIHPLPETTREIQAILSSQEPPLAEPNGQLQPKQWKAKQIWEHYQVSNLTSYKVYCETNNKLDEDWEDIWAEFETNLAAMKTFKEAEPIIRVFIENLRKNRHNELVEKHNHAKNPLDRKNRQQWPAASVLRAYKEGQLDLFQKFQENYTGDAADDPKWQKRWGDFVAKLAEADRSDEEKIQTIQKFMQTQRTRVYRKISKTQS